MTLRPSDIPDGVTDEYLDDYNNSGAEDYGISYEDYAEDRTIDDYGMTSEEMDSGDID